MEMAVSLMCQFTAEPGSIHRLIRKAKAGDVSSFEQIVMLYERTVLRLARRLLLDPEMARDAAQEVFLRLHSKLGKFQEDRALAPWLYRITVNLCHDLQRRSKPSLVVALDFAESLRDSALNPEQSVALLQQQELVIAALKELTPREREAIVLRDLEGLSTAEVARVLRSSEGTVRSQISTGRVKIKRFVMAQLGRQA
jgi:RNA polymerase sigma-70 factor (ECF subfamily)